MSIGQTIKVTVEYREDNGRMIPLRVHTIVISIQHSPDESMEQMKTDLKEKVIKVPAIPESLIYNRHYSFQEDLIVVILIIVYTV